MQTREIDTKVSWRNTKKKVEASSSSSDASQSGNSQNTAMGLTEKNSVFQDQELNMTNSIPTEEEGGSVQIGSTTIVNDNSCEAQHIDGGLHIGYEDDILLGEDGNIAFKKHVDTSATDNVDHGISSSQFESSIQTNIQWVQSTNDLKYEKDGDFYIDRLNHFWIQKNLDGHIDVTHRDQWGTFDGKYFQRIETVDLFHQQASTLEAEREHSLGNRDIVPSSMLPNLKIACIDAEASTFVGMDKVQETPFE